MPFRRSIVGRNVSPSLDGCGIVLISEATQVQMTHVVKRSKGMLLAP